MHKTYVYILYIDIYLNVNIMRYLEILSSEKGYLTLL